mmetsp:Transcript_18560/g.45543  ORF Transcript_18560/g.45543 Transcript_18560/m.45543 type:complete len:217 (+) Transcript_18560:1004-1654(+)
MGGAKPAAAGPSAPALRSGCRARSLPAPSTAAAAVQMISPSSPKARARIPLYIAPYDVHARQKIHQMRSIPGIKVTCKANESAEDTFKKYGLEFGLFKAMRSGSKDDAKSLLKKYGSAYLATSISLAAISFGICYILVDNGVDVPAFLSKIGIESSAATSKAGTAAIAYAAHKAASPIRFPPTVALTPIVAERLFGQKVDRIETPKEGADGPGKTE